MAPVAIPGTQPEELKFSLSSPCSCAESHVKEYQRGNSEGYEIVCMDGSFHVHEYCLYNSEFLYKMLKGLDFYSENFRQLWWVYL